MGFEEERSLKPLPATEVRPLPTEVMDDVE